MVDDMIMNLPNYFPKMTLRIKVTDRCNLACAFCHKEGAMEGLSDISADEMFFANVEKVCAKEDIHDIVLTGGEPTTNSELMNIIKYVYSIKGIESIRLVTNGNNACADSYWKNLFNAGLSSVTFSINSTNEQIVKQKQNIKTVMAHYIYTKINIVVFDTLELLEDTLAALSEFSETDIVLLNNVYAAGHSQQVIGEFLRKHDFFEKGVIVRNGTSNAIKEFVNPQNKVLFVKQYNLYRHSKFCHNCMAECHEGYYGLRFEKRGKHYYIRTCLDRNDSAVLVPVEDFCLR